MKQTAMIIAFGLIVGMLPVAWAAEAESTDSNWILDLQSLVLPVSEDGRLINYLFVSAQIEIADGHNHWEFRENAHIYRDLILKEAHKTSAALSEDSMKLDRAKFEKIVTSAFDKQGHADAVDKIILINQDSQKLFAR